MQLVKEFKSMSNKILEDSNTLHSSRESSFDVLLFTETFLKKNDEKDRVN